MSHKPTVLITGSSRGIGRVLAHTFAHKGYNVLINYVQHKEKAENIARQIRAQGGTCQLYKADISQPDKVRAMVCDIIRDGKNIDVLINNAGVIQNRAIQATTSDEWDRVVQTNLYGTFYVTRESARSMMKRRRGSIINISSLLGIRGVSGASSYAASKAGVIAFTKTAAKELGRFNICVNAVLPGFHSTDMGSTAHPTYSERVKKESVLGRTTDIQELAAFILFLSKMHSISGQVFNMDSRII